MRAIVTACAALAVGTLEVAAQAPAPDAIDLLRIREAFRLTQAVQDSVWPGGWGETPFPVLLVTPEREYLMAFPRTPPGFTEVVTTSPLLTRILERPRQLQPNLLATFPAFGPPSVIVVGRPEATGKTSTAWVLTLLHERFHQFQNSDPVYYSAVEQLDLSGGDRTGMWMLNYPFPYNSGAVAERFAALSRNLGQLLEGSSAPQRRTFWNSYLAFLRELSERDRRYFSFQVWQEGVARYVELRAAEVAARTYDPVPEFKALPDFRPLSAIAIEMRAAILRELENPDLPGHKRVSFYAFGAGLALLLDMDVPSWKGRYLDEKFAVERYFTPAG